MIKIHKHPRGLAIQVDGGLANNPFIRQLEGRIGLEKMLTYKGSLILPTDVAGDVFEVIGVEHAEWDADLLRQARNKVDHRLRQLRARVEVAQALENPQVILADYGSLSRLDAHQVEAVAAMCVPSLRGMAIFDEQGSGKTIMALAAFDRLRELGTVEALLVIAPKSVLASWRAECEAFLAPDFRIVMVEGPATKRRQVIQDRHDILLISYDGAMREHRILQLVIAAKPETYMLILDESYFLKNPDTLRAQVMAKLRPFCERAIVLCGTPAPNAAIDIVNQIDIADGGVAFAHLKKTGTDQATAEEIERALGNAIYLRRLKEEVFPGIPSKEIERVFIELTPLQRQLYERAYNELVVAVKKVDEREFTRHLSSFLARRIALLQICSHPAALDPLYSEDPSKLLALDVLLEELVERQSKKIVIWSFFRRSLQSIAERYAHYGVARIDGSVSRIEDRITAIQNFQHDPNTRLFIGNAASAGAGITLTSAHHAIYESFSNQAAHYMQSVDRIHRRGQTNNVTYHVLLSKNTIEEHEFNRILDKERASRDLLGDRYHEPMTRERFLAELESRNN